MDTAEGYPAFILDQDLETDELDVKLTYRPSTRIRTSFSYQFVSTEFETETDTEPPSSVESGNYDANVYSLGLSVMPVARFYLTGVVTYRDIRTHGFDNGVDSVVTYEGDVISFTGNAVYAVTEKTDLEFGYIFSRSENSRDNEESGLPLLLDHIRHRLLATASHNLTENLSLLFRYGFYAYDEDSNLGIDDYHAHRFGVGAEVKF
ncbi:MAG: hypothetical protein ACOC0U_05500 [Desulfovibrionales bacterium]